MAELITKLNLRAERTGGGGTDDHSQLTNLDYENSGHTGFQATIDDLDEIRSGAEAGATAVQDEDYVHTDNNFTNEDKQQIGDNKSAIETIETEIDNLDASKVPTTRKINNKQLNQDITLTPSDIGIGNVFTLKGSVATIEDLPSTGNTIGDVYYVEAEEVGYIWLEKQSVLQWEQLGLPIDLSNYVEKNQVSTIELTGESGTLTDTQMALILANKKNIVLNNGGDNYYLSNDESTLTYLTYFSVVPTSASSLEYKAIYIQINESAVNYKHWNIEEITLSNNDPVIITALTNTTVNGYQVPSLTTANIQAIYNGIVAGKEVVVVDATETMHFKVNQADSVADEIFISFLYFDIMILQYDENENITFKEIASKEYVDDIVGDIQTLLEAI